MSGLMEQESIGKRTLSRCSQRSVRLEGRLLRIPQFSSNDIWYIWTRFTLLSPFFFFSNKGAFFSGEKMPQQVYKERGWNPKDSFLHPLKNELKLIIFSNLFSNLLFPLAKVAIKFVSKKMQKKEQVAQEADVLLHVQNHQLVALLDTYESPTSLMLVLEL